MWHARGYGGWGKAEAVVVPGFSHALVTDWNADNRGLHRRCNNHRRGGAPWELDCNDDRLAEYLTFKGVHDTFWETIDTYT